MFYADGSNLKSFRYNVKYNYKTILNNNKYVSANHNYTKIDLLSMNAVYLT